MDGNTQVETNREALKRILAMLVAMAEMAGGASPCPAISTAPSCGCCVRPNPPPGASSSRRRAASW